MEEKLAAPFLPRFSRAVLPGIEFLQQDPTLVSPLLLPTRRGISRVTRNRWEVWLLNYEYRQFYELMAVTDCAASTMERRWDFLSLSLFFSLSSFHLMACNGLVSDSWSCKVIVFSLQPPILHFLSRKPRSRTWCETDKGHTRPELMIMSIILSVIEDSIQERERKRLGKWIFFWNNR